jgi:SM-20-related protein
MLTGTRLGPNSPPEAYALPEGSFLGPHTDRVYGRRIALVIYLNPEWEPEFGGALHIVQNDGAVARILPRRGSLLLFDVDTHKEHYIGVVTPQCGGQSRLTLSCWFENPRE